jgi:hypothetical protein
MKAPHLSKSHHSPYFGPGLALAAVATFFFGWALLISSQDWMGQAIWGALAGVIAVVLLTLAARDSRRTLRSAA